VVAVDRDGRVVFEAIGAVARKARERERVGLYLRGRLYLDGSRAIAPRLEIS
jgi:hypothetical protein